MSFKKLDRKFRNSFKNPALAFGTNFAAAMGLLAFGGHWLDVKYATGDRYVLIGVLLALVYGGYELWKIIRFSKEQEEAETELYSPFPESDSKPAAPASASDSPENPSVPDPPS